MSALDATELYTSLEMHHWSSYSPYMPKPNHQIPRILSESTPSISEDAALVLALAISHFSWRKSATYVPGLQYRPLSHFHSASRMLFLELRYHHTTGLSKIPHIVLKKKQLIFLSPAKKGLLGPDSFIPSQTHFPSPPSQTLVILIFSASSIFQVLLCSTPRHMLCLECPSFLFPCGQLPLFLPHLDQTAGSQENLL